MRASRIRTIAHAVVFGGWMLPMLLAELMPAPAAATAPDAVRAFRVVGGGWAFLAVGYGLVIALRTRRSIAD